MNWFWNWLEELVTKRKRKQLEKIYDSLEREGHPNLMNIAKADDIEEEEYEDEIEEYDEEYDDLKQGVEGDHPQHSDEHLEANPVNFEKTDVKIDFVSEDYYEKEYKDVPEVNMIMLDDSNIPTPEEIFEVFFEEILDCKTDVEVAMVMQEFFNEVVWDVRRTFIKENIKLYANMYEEY